MGINDSITSTDYLNTGKSYIQPQYNNPIATFLKPILQPGSDLPKTNTNNPEIQTIRSKITAGVKPTGNVNNGVVTNPYVQGNNKVVSIIDPNTGAVKQVTIGEAGFMDKYGAGLNATLGVANTTIGVLSGIQNIVTARKSREMMNKQMEIADKQEARAEEEYNHLRETRSKLSAAY